MSDTAPHQDLVLAGEFPATDRPEWLALVQKALKDRPFDRLISQTYDGIPVEPLYSRAAGAAAVPGRAPGQAWTVMQRIEETADRPLRPIAAPSSAWSMRYSSQRTGW